MAETKVTSLKLLIDKKANKFLFAEAGKDFVDCLFNLISLPAASIINYLISASMFGCIGKLYESLASFNETYVQPNQNRNFLLQPPTPVAAIGAPLLLPATGQDPIDKIFYTCYGIYCHGYMTDDKNTPCPSCGYSVSTQARFVSSDANEADSTSQKGLVKDLATYMVMDDLSVTPMSIISCISLLNKCNVKYFSALEERKVEFSVNEGVELLKASLHSKTALTDVFVAKKESGEV